MPKMNKSSLIYLYLVAFTLAASIILFFTNHILFLLSIVILLLTFTLYMIIINTNERMRFFLPVIILLCIYSIIQLFIVYFKLHFPGVAHVYGLFIIIVAIVGSMRRIDG